MNKQVTPLRLTVLLGALIALPALGTDMFVPALPLLAQALSAPVSAAQLTLTTYFIGLAAGQLLWGPLSDRFGRKPVLLAMVMMAILAVIDFVTRRRLWPDIDLGHARVDHCYANPLACHPFGTFRPPVLPHLVGTDRDRRHGHARLHPVITRE